MSCEEPISISITHDGRTFTGEYIVEEEDDGHAYVTVTSDGYRPKTSHLGGLNAEWLARDLLRAMMRDKPV